MDAPIRTVRLALVPVVAEDADELAAVFADERLYAFTGGGPGTVEELRETLGRLARGRADDPWAQRNWVVRRLADQRTVGMLQAVFGDGGQSAEIAWLVGVPWQGQGLASEAAAVTWLVARGVAQVTAWIRPDHHASESVAKRAGLAVTDETRTTDKHQHTERLWRRRLPPADLRYSSASQGEPPAREGMVNEQEVRELFFEQLQHLSPETEYELRHPDYVMEMPQSGERIRGRERMRAFQEAYPNPPTIQPRRVVGAGDVWVIEARSDYGDGQFFNVAMIVEFRDGKIWRDTRYYAQPFEPPEWRAQWVEPMEDPPPPPGEPS